MTTDFLQSTLEEVERLFSDTSVPLETTLDRLEAVRDEVEEWIRCIERDIENRDRG